MIWNIPSDVVIFAVVVLGFFAVGLPMITSKVFIWSFLLTYVLLRIMVPLGFLVPLVLGLWTAVVAHWAAPWRDRRHALV